MGIAWEFGRYAGFQLRFSSRAFSFNKNLSAIQRDGSLSIPTELPAQTIPQPLPIDLPGATESSE